MMTGAALGGALTVPIAEAIGSWPAALAVWAVPAAIGLVVWWVVEGGRERAHAATRPTAGPASASCPGATGGPGR